jgi:hypothetical protein
MSSKVPFGALAGLKYHLKLTKAGKTLLKRTITLTATGSFTPGPFQGHHRVAEDHAEALTR